MRTSISLTKDTSSLNLKPSFKTTSNCNPFLTCEDLDFIHQAQIVGSLSKDPNRKVGCLIVVEGAVVARGYNKFPAGLSESLERFNNREYKAKSILHAEIHAILESAKAAHNLKGGTAYVTYHPCASCASCFIQAGITKVVCPSPQSGSPKWHSDFKVASDNFYEAGVLVLYFSPSNGSG